MARTKRPPAKKKGKGKAAATGSSSHDIPRANATTTGDTNEATSSGTTNNSAPANTAAPAPAPPPLLSLASAPDPAASPAPTSAPSATSASAIAPAPPPATTSTQAPTTAAATTTSAPTTTAAPDTTSGQAEPSQTPSDSKGPETRGSLRQKNRKAAEPASAGAKTTSEQPESTPAKTRRKGTTKPATKEQGAWISEPGGNKTTKYFWPAKEVQAQHKDKNGEMWYEMVWKESWVKEADVNEEAMDAWNEKLIDKNFNPEASFSHKFPEDEIKPKKGSNKDSNSKRPAATTGPGQTSCPTIPLDNSNERNMSGETGQGATNAGDAGGHGTGDAGVVDLDEADDGDATYDGGQALGGLDSVSTAGREISAKEKARTLLKRTRSVVETGPDDAGGPSTAKTAEKEPEHVDSDSNCEPSSSGSPKPKRRGRPPRKSTASPQEGDSVVNDAPRTPRGRKGATTKEKAKRGAKK